MNRLLMIAALGGLALAGCKKTETTAAAPAGSAVPTSMSATPGSTPTPAPTPAATAPAAGSAAAAPSPETVAKAEAIVADMLTMADGMVKVTDAAAGDCVKIAAGMNDLAKDPARDRIVEARKLRDTDPTLTAAVRDAVIKMQKDMAPTMQRVMVAMEPCKNDAAVQAAMKALVPGQ